MPAPSATYRRIVLERPWIALALLAALLGLLSWQARHFDLDASAESLLLEDDPDLRQYREVVSRYGTQDLLVVTFRPLEGGLFDDASLSRLRELRDTLLEVPSVDSVRTLLDVPLIQSSDAPLAELVENIPTLERGGVDRERARAELRASPVFRDLILSDDARTTALLLELRDDPEFMRLQRERNRLLDVRGKRALTAEEAASYDRIVARQRQVSERLGAARHTDIARIREILEQRRGAAELHLGGAPMIADDMITFVRNDLIVFGTGVFVFLVIVLAVIFRRPRWVVLPLASCAYAGLAMIGLLGWVGWPVTVISSNFLALMLIITISMSIHIAVRYRELAAEQRDASQIELVEQTVRRMVWPCLYTALTTIIGFASLVFSNIVPVQDFGWMMSAGLAVAFLVSFTLLPALLVLFEPLPPPHGIGGFRYAPRIASFTLAHGPAIVVTSLIVGLVGLVGMSRLTVENAFIDYFRDDTEIARGMRLIDRELGGTTPLDVTLDFGLPDDDVAAAEDEEDEDFDDWLDEPAPEYWFTPYKISEIKRVHDFLAGLPEIGKVLSLASMVRVVEARNDGEELEGIELSLLYTKLPEDIRDVLISPYVSVEDDEARLQVRIRDSQPGLRRAELLQRIQSGLERELGLAPDRFEVSGTLVLYNNMLQSLFRSQAASLAAVLVGIGIMFGLLFRSWKLAVIGLAPQLLAAGAVLGLLGLLGIPLDMMTITIAAVTIGIAVDDAIHYLYRFREELPAQGDYEQTLRVCHATIGTAVFYTSATVVFGFSILGLSNFWPTVYFGVFTGLAMILALLGALTLLPRMVLWLRPFSLEGAGQGAEAEPAEPEARTA